MGVVAVLVAALGPGTAALAAKRTKTKTFSTGSISLALPTTDSPYELATVNVPVRKAKIKDVNVALSAGHESAGELDFKLLPPNGPDVNLASGLLNITDNWGTAGCGGTVTFDDESSGGKIDDETGEIEGSYRPTSPLSALDGKSPQGNWRLAVNDDVGGNAGNITCFEVKVKYKKAKKKRK